MRIALAFIKAFIVVGVMLAAVQVGLLFVSPAPAPAGTVVYEGTVTAVSPVWTGNGDGSITVDDTPVLIVGTPGNDRPTVFKLKHRYVVDLIGRRILVKGKRCINGIIARVIEEI